MKAIKEELDDKMEQIKHLMAAEEERSSKSQLESEQSNSTLLLVEKQEHMMNQLEQLRGEKEESNKLLVELQGKYEIVISKLSEAEMKFRDENEKLKLSIVDKNDEVNKVKQ